MYHGYWIVHGFRYIYIYFFIHLHIEVHVLYMAYSKDNTNTILHKYYNLNRKLIE